MMQVELVDPEGQLLGEIADTSMTRDDVALTYTLALQSPAVDWGTVNRAIVERWSLSALKYIKEKAWRNRA